MCYNKTELNKIRHRPFSKPRLRLQIWLRLAWPRVCFVIAHALRTCSELQTREQSLKPIPKSKPWPRKESQATHMSAQLWSPMISIALRCSPAERYISAAARGSLMFLAQSACLVIRSFLSWGSPDPMNSCCNKNISWIKNQEPSLSFNRGTQNLPLPSEVERISTEICDPETTDPHRNRMC